MLKKKETDSNKPKKRGRLVIEFVRPDQNIKGFQSNSGDKHGDATTTNASGGSEDIETTLDEIGLTKEELREVMDEGEQNSGFVQKIIKKLWS
ncbi:MAG: hypothetical protein FWC91_10270 [Defluviitaleaceae bacterium]|nr:hypothetical protein [Defluviitaleaceae bacterium]